MSLTEFWHFPKDSNIEESCFLSFCGPLRGQGAKTNAALVLQRLDIFWFDWMLAAAIQVHMLFGLLASGKNKRWKASPHRPKDKALCDVQTFTVREAD